MAHGWKDLSARAAQLPLHPWLFAVAPVLYLWARNFEAVARVTDVLTASLMVLGLATILFLAGWLAYRDVTKAAVAASAGVLAVLLFGHVFQLLARWPALGRAVYDGRIWIGAALLVAVGLLAWRLRTWALPGAVTRLANVVAVGFVAIQFVSLAFAFPGADVDPPAPVAIEDVDATAPDIHFIVLDGFAGMQTLDDRYGLDAHALLEPFIRSGFRVHSHSYSNYGDTYKALPTVLNLEYWGALPGAPEDKIDAVRVLTSDSMLARALQEAGYRHVHMRSGWWLSETSRTADEETDCQALAPFHRLLLESTPVVMVREIRYEVARTQIECSFRHVARLPEHEGPVFTFTHMDPPHPPYVYDRNGTETSHVDPRLPWAGWDADAAYKEQLLYTVDRLHEALQQAIQAAAPEDVFVVLADHGPKVDARPDPADGLDADTRTLLHRHNVLLMVRGPGFTPGFDAEPTTTVNVGRTVLDSVLGTDLGPLPDLLCPSTAATVAGCEEIPPRLR